MNSLRVLLTNMSLVTRSGTETYVRDLAFGLLRRGHTPIVYSTYLGELARELQAATVMVVNDLRAVAVPPDLIHGHHHPETMTALLHFPNVPAIFCCHGRLSVRDTPPRSERILRYVAVDDTVRDRLLYEEGIPADRLAMLRNAVDLDRFRTRPPLPSRPQRALVFSHYANEHTHLPAVREACARVGLPLDVIGMASDNICSRPEEVLGRYDLVFAKARCALEALAVGAAVVLCDTSGAGPLVTAAEYEELRRFNLGVRTLRYPLSADVLVREMARYDPADASAVCGLVRAGAGVEPLIDAALALYREVLSEHRAGPPVDALAERQNTAAYLRWLTSVEELCAFEKVAHRAECARAEMRAERDHWRAQFDQALAQREEIRGQWIGLQVEYDRLRAEHAHMSGEYARTSAAHFAALLELGRPLQAKVGRRLLLSRERLLRLPLLGRFLRSRYCA